MFLGWLHSQCLDQVRCHPAERARPNDGRDPPPCLPARVVPSPDSDFFGDLGGDSLQAAKLVAADAFPVPQVALHREGAVRGFWFSAHRSAPWLPAVCFRDAALQARSMFWGGRVDGF